MDPGPPFQAFGVAHIMVILLTITLPFVLAMIVRRTKSRSAERVVVITLSAVLVVNYVVFMCLVRQFGAVSWQQILPLQLCDWGMVVVIVAMLTGNQRWFEVAYFWGIGGTLQAVLTPNLRFAFPDFRFISFFVSHCGIIVGVVFLMLVHRYRPYPMSIVRVFLWTELYFVITMIADAYTGYNYGFLLHKPEAFSILSFLSDSRPLYLVQMHGVALLFFIILYLPFAVYDLASRRQILSQINKRGSVSSPS
jgi:hypothetical integral membrane protein (TIGR02206 family)